MTEAVTESRPTDTVEEELTYRDSCPACGGHSRVIHQRSYESLSGFLSDYYKRPIALEGRYELRECDRCGTVFQAGRPSDALLRTVYNDWIGAISDDSPNERDRSEIATAQAYLGKRRLRTLDFGMGHAAWARSALELGADSHGIDLSEHAMTHARSHGIKTTDDGPFNFINAEQVFEHLEHPREIAAELVAKLVPGGVLKISVPAKPRLDLSGDPPDPVHPLEHLNCFTEMGLQLMVGLPMVRPSITQRFARRPAGLKELVRPFWTWNNRTNLYRWFRKPDGNGTGNFANGKSDG